MQIYNSNSCSNAFFYAEDKNVALRWKFSCVGAGGAAAAEAKPQILRQGVLSILILTFLHQLLIHRN